MDFQKIPTEKLNVYLQGWKGLANYYGVHLRTLQRWDAKLPIPWDKRGPKKNDSVRIHALVADKYYTIHKS